MARKTALAIVSRIFFSLLSFAICGAVGILVIGLAMRLALHSSYHSHMPEIYIAVAIVIVMAFGIFRSLRSR
ncbi:hypothetical protein [Sphingomonas oryzagri]